MADMLNALTQAVAGRTSQGDRNRVSAAVEALLFADGGDYTPRSARGHADPTRLPTDQSQVDRRRHSSVEVSSSGGGGGVADEDVLTLGRLRRAKSNTVHRIRAIHFDLQQKPIQEVTINMDDDTAEKVPLQRRHRPEDMDTTDGATLRRESELLKESLEAQDTELHLVKEKMANIPIMQYERERVNDPLTREQFIEDIFTSVREGNLESLKIKIAAFDMETPVEVGLKDLVESRSQLPILHVALMSDKREVVQFLIEHGGQDLTTKTVPSGDCTNLTPFYIALVHQNFEALRLIVESVSDATDRASMINQVVLHRMYDGEMHEVLPLFCLVTSSSEDDMTEVKEVIDYLVDNGADIENRDSDGNTILHRIVKESVSKQSSSVRISVLRQFLLEVFGNASAKWWKRKLEVEEDSAAPLSLQESKVQATKYLFNLRNDANQCPLALAAQTESPLYVDFVQWENVTRFSDPQLGRQFNKTYTYDVTDITSTDHRGKYSKSSVMHIVAHNTVNLTSRRRYKVEDILNTEPIKSLIKLKWQDYRWVFYVMGFLHLSHMIALTAFVFSDHVIKVSNKTHAESHRSPDERTYRQNIVDHWYFIWILFLPTLYLITEFFDLCYNASFRSRCPSHGNSLYRFLLISFSLSSWLWFFIQWLSVHYGNGILAFILLEGWLFVIFLTRGIILPWKNIQIGIFPSMLQRIIFFDVVPFAVMAVIILVSFSAAFHVLVIQSPSYDLEHKYNYAAKVYLMVKYLVGMPNPQDYKYSNDDVMPKVLLIIFGLISSVLLVNMLIAAMNRSYELIRSSESNPLWRQRLSILLMVERRVPACLRRRTQRCFAVLENPRTGRMEMFLKIVDHY